MDKFIIEGQDLMDLFYNREDVERIYVCTEEPYETDIEPNVDWYQIVEFGYRGIAVEDQWGYSAKPIKYEDVTYITICLVIVSDWFRVCTLTILTHIIPTIIVATIVCSCIPIIKVCVLSV